MTFLKSLLAFLFLSISIPFCDSKPKWHQPKTDANIRIIFSINDCEEGENKLNEVKQQLVTRLETNHIFYQNINANVEKQEIVLDIINAEDKSKSVQDIRESLITSADLKLVTAVQATDDLVKNWVAKIKENETGIAATLTFNENVDGSFFKYSTAVLAECSKKNLPQLKEIFTKYEKGSGIKFRWGRNNSYSKNQPDYKDYLLYGFLEKEKEVITTKHLTGASAGPDPYTGQQIISVSFNQQGAKFFAQMTKKAAEDSNREILIMISEEIYSAPRVNEAITGGQCSISGDFSLKEAADLATLLNVGSFVCNVKIISEDTINK